MEGKCQNSDFNSKYLLSQLIIARKEINNLRQQIRSLRYVHEKDVENIKYLLRSYQTGKGFVPLKRNVSKTVRPSTSNDANECLKLKPIGVISTWFPTKRGTPRQPGICGTAPGKLTLFNSIFTNPEHALDGLQDFSHMWILFHFHRNESTHMRAKVAPPRLNGARTGVFSTRSPHRPCPIGLSLVKITKIENYSIFFEGVDMINQTPVLDVKPYIPQYDNPLHFEKYSNTEGQNLTDRESLGNIEERTNLESSERLTAQNVETNNGLRATLQESYHSSTDGAAHGTDISKDEEIALRLQAEEFDGHSEFGNYLKSRNYYPTVDRNLDVVTGFENGRASSDGTSNLEASRELSNGTNPDLGLYDERDVTSSDISMQNSSDVTRVSIVTDSNFQSPRNSGIIDRSLEVHNENALYSLQHIDLHSEGNSTITFNSRNIEVNDPSDQVSRNTRLLDGADGPSTDIDLIHRRAINPRLDNSPIRMGIREAPDGEEGFNSQNLASSQTLSNIQGVAPSGISQNVGNAQNVRTESGSHLNLGHEDNSSEIRIPDWISRPSATPLTVTFNERALVQLNEILGDKADQQKQAIENVLCQDPRFDDNRHVVTVFQIRHAGRMCECGEPEWQCLGHSPLT